MKDGTKAELVVDRQSISNKAFREMMETKGLHKVLDEGTCLLVCLTIKPESPPLEKLRPLLTPYENFGGTIATQFLDIWNPHTLAFVEVNLSEPDDKQARLLDTSRGGLWLTTQGLEAVGLVSTTVLLPSAITAEPVASLNHAYTKLSETFETWRISHTGNIYHRVLYQEGNGWWYPLDILRNKALEKQEQTIAKGLWEGLMAKMIRQI